MRHLKLFESLEDIHSICKEYGIENYTINSDGSIDVDGSIRMKRGRQWKLTKLPLKFRNVSGYFYCNNNQLTSLEGCPISVGGNFYCSYNFLTSLKGCPESVGGNFYCNHNQLTSLEGYPTSVGGNFYCNNNQITSFEGWPNHIDAFYCGNNPICYVWELFKDYSKMEFFNDCDIIRDGGVIILDRLNFFLEEIGKRPVKKVTGYKCI